MRLTIVLLGFIIGLFSVPVMAGSNHDHGDDHGHSHSPVDQATAVKKAEEIVKALVKREKIDKSWKGISAASVEKKEFNNNQEWVVIFSNKGLADSTKQKFYVFLTLGGDYIAANYTGQ